MIPRANSSPLDLDRLLNALADRVAENLHAKLAQDGARAPVRPRLLTVEQAAAYLGRTKEGLQHIIGSGKLPVVRADRRVFLDVRDLDGWIECNKTTGV
jgi:excisionase family DNA binding protein